VVPRGIKKGGRERKSRPPFKATSKKKLKKRLKPKKGRCNLSFGSWGHVARDGMEVPKIFVRMGSENTITL